MSWRDDLEREPWRFDFFDTLRRIERDFTPRAPGDRRLPRIGDAASWRDEYVFLGQDPFLEFPASNLSAFARRPGGGYRALVRFLGLLGPMGALPLATTEEAFNWLRARDDAFPRFLDIFNHRFLQLFFRAWADARPAAQHDRPNADRFIAYIGSAIGLGSPPFANLDAIPDSGKLGLAGLLGAKAKSASRLVGAIRNLFHVRAEVEQFVGARLELAWDDRSRLGEKLSGLGVDAMLGGSFYSVQDKFRLRIIVEDLEHYRRFLPRGDLCGPLADLVFFIVGDEIDWDVELALPAACAPPLRIGSSAALGWTTWLAPDPAQEGYRTDARFHAAERRRHERARADATAETHRGDDGRHQP